MQIFSIGNSFSFGSQVKEVTVNNKNGIHARLAGNLVSLIQLADSDKYDPSITITVNGNEQKKLESSILQIIKMGLSQGTKLEVKADDKFPDSLFDAITSIFGAHSDDEAQKIATEYIQKHAKV